VNQHLKLVQCNRQIATGSNCKLVTGRTTQSTPILTSKSTTLQQFYFQFIMAGTNPNTNRHLLHHGQALLHPAWHLGVRGSGLHWSSLRKSVWSTRTTFQPSGSTKEAIFVLIPGSGPGCRKIFPPSSLVARSTASALLYTSLVPIAT